MPLDVVSLSLNCGEITAMRLSLDPSAARCHTHPAVVREIDLIVDPCSSVGPMTPGTTTAFAVDMVAPALISLSRSKVSLRSRPLTAL
jgi:hypothetical protein